MDTSVIDLCDSDDNGDVVQIQNASVKKGCDDDDSSSSSSSSSDDSHLWNAGGFLKGSPPRKKEAKRANYFKEVKSKYNDGDNDNGNGRTKQQKRARNNDCHDDDDAKSRFENSPIVSLEIEADDGSESDGSLKPAAASPKNIDSLLQKEETNNGNGGTRKEKKRKLSPERSFNNERRSLSNPGKKPCGTKSKIDDDDEVECIEIDLSDSSSEDDAGDRKVAASKKGGYTISSSSAKNNANNDSKPSIKSAIHDHDEPDDSDFSADFGVQKKRRLAAKKAAHNPYANKKKAQQQNSYKTKQIPSIPAKKKKSYDSEDSNDEDDNDSYSSGTVSLHEEDKPATRYHAEKQMSLSKWKEGPDKKKKNNGKKGRVSFNKSDDVNEFVVNDDDADEFDFGGTSYGGFDEDDEERLASNDGDTKKFGKSDAKPKKSATKSLKKDGSKLLDLDSDDDSCSNSSTELFTPRPFKKKAKKPSPAVAVNKSGEHFATKTPSTASSKAISSEMPCPNSTSSKLLTPHAFSPATTSPTLGTYAVKKQVPTPAIPAMPSKLVKEIGGKLYPDLRHNFLVALTSHARRLRHNSYQRASFDSALRSVVVISLHTSPLRSAEAARRIKGVGSNFYDLLKESTTGAKGKKPFAPANGKYSCVSAAALVALLELEEANASVASANGKSFPMEDLIRRMNQLLDARANASLNQTAEKYLDPDNLDPGWGQIKKLASTNAAADLGGPFIKERKKKDACVSGRIYELLDSGREHAKKLKQLAQLGPADSGPLRQLPDETVDEEFGNVTMSMDFREGGGGGKSLHKMCDHLDVRGCPYVVRELKIADYIFFVGDKLAPILIERKTADDVAASLHDGRWERQKRSMRKAQYVLGGGPARRCQICYIIEGDAAKRTVHGGNVGRRTYFQSLEDVESAIDQLPSQGFSVMKSKGHLDTIGVLAKIAQDVSWKAKNGSIDANFTYKQFLSRVKALGDEFGDAPTSREHQNPAPPVVVNEEHIPASSNIPTPNDDTFSPQADDPRQKNNAQAERTTLGSSMQSLREENNEEYSALKKMSVAQLKERCKERDEKMGGKKDELIERLLKPRKPEILIMRARRGEYVPKVPSSNAALMVALLLHHVPGTQGLAKERLMVMAEETGASKESMSGDGGSFYDGWSGVKQLQQGDPALVRMEKGHRYSLTTQPPETSGRAVAHALHILAHREGLCMCGNPPPE